MRVIAGTAKRLLLKTVSGLETRPTTDRIKETLFNIIQNELCEVRFLDLFAGSGAIGIEALSRGASEAVFVEHNREAVQCIKDNLITTNFILRGNILQMDVMAALEKLKCGPPFDVVFMDPPYHQGWDIKIVTYLANSEVITDDTLLIIEAAKETNFDDIGTIGFSLLKRKEYKTNAHLFLQREKGAKQ